MVQASDMAANPVPQSRDVTASSGHDGPVDQRWDDLAAATRAVNTPATPAADLAQIAFAHPSLRSGVAWHTNVYPGLLTWLAEYGDQSVARVARLRLGARAVRNDQAAVRSVLAGHAAERLKDRPPTVPTGPPPPPGGPILPVETVAQPVELEQLPDPRPATPPKARPRLGSGSGSAMSLAAPSFLFRTRADALDTGELTPVSATPAAPVAPVADAEPAAPEKPTDSTEPAAPSDPIDAAEPAAPEQPDGGGVVVPPVKPIDGAEPAAAAKAADKVKPDSPAKPVTQGAAKRGGSAPVPQPLAPEPKAGLAVAPEVVPDKPAQEPAREPAKAVSAPQGRSPVETVVQAPVPVEPVEPVPPGEASQPQVPGVGPTGVPPSSAAPEVMPPEVAVPRIAAPIPLPAVSADGPDPAGKDAAPIRILESGLAHDREPRQAAPPMSKAFKAALVLVVALLAACLVIGALMATGVIALQPTQPAGDTDEVRPAAASVWG
jgi:hypothetical protein